MDELKINNFFYSSLSEKLVGREVRMIGSLCLSSLRHFYAVKKAVTPFYVSHENIPRSIIKIM